MEQKDMSTRILNKIDNIDEKIGNIDVTLATQEENLKHHMRRTELAEESIEILAKQIKPISKHVYHVEGAFKLLGLGSVVLTIIFGLMKVFGVAI